MKINLLWTGGLDSTFRLVELAQYDIEIQPYYIIDNARSSIIKEKTAMEKILRRLRTKNFTKAKINDIKYIPVSEIIPDEKITVAHKHFVNFNKLGAQYDFLARFASQNNLILEVGLENSDRSKAATALKMFGNLRLNSYKSSQITPPEITDWHAIFEITPNTAHPDAKVVFENLRFPAHLFSIEKIDEAKLLKEWGCNDIFRLTWFCHNPVFGLPCGRCNPCKDALNEGLAWRVPITGRVLGFIRGGFRKCWQFIAKLLFIADR